MILFASRGPLIRKKTAPAPTINGFESLDAFTPAADPHTISLAGQTWSVGDYLLAHFGTNSTATIDSMAGSTDDTYAEITEIDHASGGSNLAVYEGTVVGGALDANLSVNIGASREGVGGLITISGAAANASQPDVAPSTNQGEDVSPVCSSINTVTNNCLVFAIFNARGGHFEAGPPTPPSGWQFLFSGNTGLTQASTSQASGAVAYKVQATAGATGNATWTNALDVSQRWTAIQIAVRPA